MSIYGDLPKEILDKLNESPEHTVLEIWAIDFFKGKGEQVTAVEKKLEQVSEMITYRVIDLITEDQDGTKALVECKHGDEPSDKVRLDQIEDYFAYAKYQISQGEKIEIRLFIGKDITGDGAKKYVRHAIELHEAKNVPLKIYIKGELKSLDEVKKMIGG
jgi:hypothetical protein